MNARQKLFAAKYVELMNETKAAAAAGYSVRSAAVQGSRLLRNVNVQQEIERLFANTAMGRNELLWRLTEVARSDMDNVMTVQGNLPFVDMEKAQQAAKTGLIKKIKITKQGIEFELHDKMRALELLGKYYAMFTENIQVIDWRKEAQEAGLDPAALFDELIGRTLTTSVQPVDARSGESEDA